MFMLITYLGAYGGVSGSGLGTKLLTQVRNYIHTQDTKLVDW
jgi:hypothetical protein